jgi:hypothetical protein
MSEHGGIGPAEAGGMLGGLVTLMGFVGGGVAWLFNRSDQRRSARETKLDAWHEELEAREKRLDEGRTAYIVRLEERLGSIEESELLRDKRDKARDLQLTALRLSFELVSAALRAVDPANRALQQAEDLLHAAFPVKLGVTADIIDQLRRIDEADALASA